MSSNTMQAPEAKKPRMALKSIPEIISTANGPSWAARRDSVYAQLTPKSYRQYVTQYAAPDYCTDLTGSEVYACAKEGEAETRYNIVNTLQVNYPRGTCAMDGALVDVLDKCYNDDNLFGDFHSRRKGAIVLDVGCNTGSNMTRACVNGGPGTEVFGIEYSHDSVALARAVHGKDSVIQGDASSDFVDKLAWQGKFTIVQCTAVLQHLTPEQVAGVMANIAKCLAPGGEFLLTFKDSPTRDQMHRRGMGHWAEEVFTADLASPDEYLRDGFLRAVMWDDDYYPGVTLEDAPAGRDLALPGIHRREFVFYSLEWIKNAALKHGLTAERVEVLPDSKIPYSALHWMVVFRSKKVVGLEGGM